jgi:galactokinase
VVLLRDKYPRIRALRDVSWEEFLRVEAELPAPVAKRCRHVISENQRTLQAAAALSGGNLSEMGKLMCESHRSLRDDYEVSCAELDYAVNVAISNKAVYGSRMTGGGFGGCTVTLLEQSAVAGVCDSIRGAFGKRFGYEPTFFTTGAAGGVRDEGGR